MTTKPEDKRPRPKELMSLADLNADSKGESMAETIADYPLHPKNDIENPSDPSEWNDFLSHVNAYAEGLTRTCQDAHTKLTLT